MKYLFIICVAFAFFFSGMLFSKKEKLTEDWLLGFIFSTITFNCFYVFLCAKNAEEFYIPYFSEFNYSLPLLYGPFTWLYTKAVTLTDFKLKKVEWLHFIPFVVFFIAISLPLWTSWQLPENTQIGYPFFKLILTPFYIIAIIILIRRYNRKFLEEYSFEMEANLTWLNWIIVGAILVWVIATLSYVYNVVNPESTIFPSDYNTLTFLTLYLFILGIVAIRHTRLFSTQAAVPAIKKVTLNPVIPEEVKTIKEDFTKADLKKLEEAMEQKEAYLDPQLTLSKLATHTGIPAYRLSKVLKQKESSFFDYVNGYRIEKVKSLLQEGKLEQLSMLGVATEAGFNSKASFNRVFKKATGITPSQYVKDNLG